MARDDPGEAGEHSAAAMPRRAAFWRLLGRDDDRPPPPSARRVPVVPPGERVYAIGDVHGCADLLERLLARIEEDHEGRGPARRTIVLLGDLIDRGPDSARVLHHARRLAAAGAVRVVKGNHEEIFVDAAHGDAGAARALLGNGGLDTLESFGVAPADAARDGIAGIPALIARHVPREVVAFLDAAEDWVAIGDYLFVHAGIRPGVPLADQAGADLRWIRAPFLHARRAHGRIVVHGHTVTPRVQERPNRIGIDTGAVRTGRLTALALEGAARWYLDTGDTPVES